jgi:hypothetical protein
MNYTARDHAFVYGAIAQAALSRYLGCEQALVDGIKTYGLQRGTRMAQAAAARAAVCKRADERLTLRYGAPCVAMLHAGLTVGYWVMPYGKTMEALAPSSLHNKTGETE